MRITYSPGGTGAAALALARAKVVIDGQCNSACAWSFVKNENACFTSRASFGFHAAHDPGSGRRMNAATTYWLSTVRGSLRGRLTPLLETSSLITLSAQQMRAHYGDRVCGKAPSTEVASVVPAAKPSKASSMRLASVETHVNARSKTVRGKRGSQGSETWSLMQLAAAVEIMSWRSFETEPLATLQTFAKTDVSFTRFDAGDDAGLASERAQAHAMLAVAELPQAETSIRVEGFADVALAVEAGVSGAFAPEALQIAAGDAGALPSGVHVAGLRDGLEASKVDAPIIVAAMASVVREEAPVEKKGMLAQLADPALRPDECDPETSSLPVVKIEEVSAGPCDTRHDHAHLTIEQAG